MGYTWEGMRKMSFEEVKEKHETEGLAGYFYLYEDGTEGEISANYTWEEIEAHYNCGGEFGEEL